jgi:Zn-dependent metalloprotease
MTCRCFIIPPGVLRRLALEATDDTTRDSLLQSIETSAFLRGRRVERLTQGIVASAAKKKGAATKGKDRTIYDAGNRRQLPGRLIRTEKGPAVGDTAANLAFDNAGITYDCYHTVFGRNSVDNAGLPLLSSVHYGRAYNNAMWDGQQMVYGDGDGKLFLGFVQALDVVGHELTHGVTQYTVPGGLTYSGLSGALNESISDVFGTIVKQWSRNETVDHADWLIGAGILGSGLGKALRSMARPGTAWKHDDQPDNMSNVDPNADVHTNSGVPNRAFYLTATALGGQSLTKAGQIWYGALPKLKADSGFREMRAATIAVAKAKYGAAEVAAVTHGWDTVGVT